MKPLSPIRINAVLALSAAGRYDHCIKQAAAWEKVCGLYDEEWAMLGDEPGRPLMPLRPALEYAQLVASAGFARCVPKQIDVHELLDTVIPTVRAEGSAIAVFPNPERRSAIHQLDDLEADLRHELSRYE